MAARHVRQQLGNGVVQSFLNNAGAATGYDAINRVVGHRVLLPGGTVALDRSYGYNRAGRRLFEIPLR